MQQSQNTDVFWQQYYNLEFAASSLGTRSVILSRNPPHDGLQFFYLTRKYKRVASGPKDHFLIHSCFAKC